MGNRFLEISLLVLSFELICFSFLGGVWGVEFSGAADDFAAGSSEWRLRVDGAVYQPLNLTLNELVSMPRNTVNAELYCFGYLVAAGNWTGVRLGLVLEKAGLQNGAVSIEFLASDGYKTLLDMASAMNEDVILAYELNGQPFYEVLRLVLPWANGDRWIAMITQITVGTVPVSIPDSHLRPPQLPQQPTTPQPMPTPQPSNQSTTPPVLPPSRQSNNSTKQQQEFLGSNPLMEFSYALLTVLVVVIAAATSYLYLKRRK